MLSIISQENDIVSDNGHADSLPQNMAISLRDQPQSRLPCHQASSAIPAPAFAGRYPSPIQDLKLPIIDPPYLPSPWQKQESSQLRHDSSSTSGTLYGHQNSAAGFAVHGRQHGPPRHGDDFRWAESSGSRPSFQAESLDHHTCHQERKIKRSRIEVQDWERKVWARSERMQAVDYSPQHQTFPHTSGTSSPVLCELPPISHSRQAAYPQAYKEQPPAYPSPPCLLDEAARVRNEFPTPSSRRPSSVFSGSTLAESPDTRRTTIISIGRTSPPHSPSTNSAFTDSDTRSTSTTPRELENTPTFEQIHDVPGVALAPRETRETSILERFPMEIFMRIMMCVGWKDQMRLKRCNTNFYHRVNLEAIPWQIKTGILLEEENFDPRNFPKKVPKARDAEDAASEDADNDSSSDDDAFSLTEGAKGRSPPEKSKAKLRTKRPRPQTKEKAHPDSLGRWACYCCFKILPAQFFEGRYLKDNGSTSAKDQKKRGQDTESAKRADLRVEYVRVIAVNPAQVPEWLIRDKVKMEATDDIAAYVRQRMEKGVNCDDLRLYFKDINSATHCIAPIRGVVPTFTENSTATPPGCETYRPFFKVPGTHTSRAEENDTYTYELGVPTNSTRGLNQMVLPRDSEPDARIIQPQTCVYDPMRNTMKVVPEIGDIMALRRFCILCGAKYGAYRRDCNRKIISKTDEGWWVCDCRQVRLAGRGKDCPDCGRKVIY